MTKGLDLSAFRFDPAQVKGKRILIVHARWNHHITNALVQKAQNILKSFDVDIDTMSVPGSYELPFACQRQLSMNRYDAAIAIGVLIKGETMHFEYISEAVAQGLMRVSLDMCKPIVFGVLTCLNEEQALRRAGMLGSMGEGHSHAEDWALTALEMAVGDQGMLSFKMIYFNVHDSLLFLSDFRIF